MNATRNVLAELSYYDKLLHYPAESESTHKTISN